MGGGHYELISIFRDQEHLVDLNLSSGRLHLSSGLGKGYEEGYKVLEEWTENGNFLIGCMNNGSGGMERIVSDMGRILRLPPDGILDPVAERGYDAMGKLLRRFAFEPKVHLENAFAGEIEPAWFKIFDDNPDIVMDKRSDVSVRSIWYLSGYYLPVLFDSDESCFWLIAEDGSASFASINSRQEADGVINTLEEHLRRRLPLQHLRSPHRGDIASTGDRSGSRQAAQPEPEPQDRKRPLKRPIALFDLDGTLRDTYAAIYPRAHQVRLFDGVADRLRQLRQRGYLLAGITNQGGITKRVITSKEVEAANDRMQELLGDARLDLILYCPHHADSDDFVCDCKKPAVGMVLDALSTLESATLSGAFVVGDSIRADKGVADGLDLPFVPAEKFRRQPLEGTLASAARRTRQFAEAAESRVVGCLVGLATGDAFGSQVEFWPRPRVRETFPHGIREMRASASWEVGQYTDDTEMALLLADALLENGALNPRDVARRFLAWSLHATDVGIQMRRVLSMPGYTESPEESARLDYLQNQRNAAGNGAVMRCAPIALFHTWNMSMLLADSRRSARITHADPKAQSSCVLVNTAIAHFLAGGGKEDAWSHGMKFLAPLEKETWKRLPQLASLGEEDISSSGYTVPTVEAAFWSLLRADSFEEAVETAAGLGGDADTVAAITGALAGAYYGYDAIPRRWLDPLLDLDRLRRTALKLYVR